MPLSRVKTQLVRYNEPLELEKEPTPETPEDGSAKLYFKDDDNLYKKTEDGVEQRVGGDLNALRIDLENQIKAAGQDNTADIFTNFVKDMEDHGKTSLHTERGFVDELETSNDMIDESNSSGFTYLDEIDAYRETEGLDTNLLRFDFNDGQKNDIDTSKNASVISTTGQTLNLNGFRDGNLAINGNLNDSYFSGTGNISINAPSQWVLDFGVAPVSKRAIVKYDIIEAETANNSPTDWTFEGSNDNVTYTTLDTQTGISWSSDIDQTATFSSENSPPFKPPTPETKTFSFSNTTKYRYYRLNVTGTQGGNNGLILTEVNLYEAIPELSNRYDIEEWTNADLNISPVTISHISGSGVNINDENVLPVFYLDFDDIADYSGNNLTDYFGRAGTKTSGATYTDNARSNATALNFSNGSTAEGSVEFPESDDFDILNSDHTIDFQWKYDTQSKDGFVYFCGQGDSNPTTSPNGGWWAYRYNKSATKLEFIQEQFENGSVAYTKIIESPSFGESQPGNFLISGTTFEQIGKFGTRFFGRPGDWQQHGFRKYEFRTALSSAAGTITVNFPTANEQNLTQQQITDQIKNIFRDPLTVNNSTGGFNGILNQTWSSTQTPTTETPLIVTYDFGVGNEQAIDEFRIFGNRIVTGGNLDRIMNNFDFEGSNDGTNYTSLITNVSTSFPNGENTKLHSRHRFTNTTSFRFYRFVIRANSNGGSGIIINQIDLGSSSQTEDVYRFSYDRLVLAFGTIQTESGNNSLKDRANSGSFVIGKKPGTVNEGNLFGTLDRFVLYKGSTESCIKYDLEPNNGAFTLQNLEPLNGSGSSRGGGITTIPPFQSLITLVNNERILNPVDSQISFDDGNTWYDIIAVSGTQGSVAQGTASNSYPNFTVKRLPDSLLGTNKTFKIRYLNFTNDGKISSTRHRVSGSTRNNGSKIFSIPSLWNPGAGDGGVVSSSLTVDHVHGVFQLGGQGSNKCSATPGWLITGLSTAFASVNSGAYVSFSLIKIASTPSPPNFMIVYTSKPFKIKGPGTQWYDLDIPWHVPNDGRNYKIMLNSKQSPSGNYDGRSGTGSSGGGGSDGPSRKLRGVLPEDFCGGANFTSTPNTGIQRDPILAAALPGAFDGVSFTGNGSGISSIGFGWFAIGARGFFNSNGHSKNAEFNSVIDKFSNIENIDQYGDINSTNFVSDFKIPNQIYSWIGFDPAQNYGPGTEIKIFEPLQRKWRVIAKNNAGTWQYNSSVPDVSIGGNDANTSLLLDFENGITDSSVNNSNIQVVADSFNNTPTIENESVNTFDNNTIREAKFGNNSLIMYNVDRNGTLNKSSRTNSPHLKINNTNNIFDFQGNDFCVDFWWKESPIIAASLTQNNRGIFWMQYGGNDSNTIANRNNFNGDTTDACNAGRNNIRYSILPNTSADPITYFAWNHNYTNSTHITDLREFDFVVDGSIVVRSKISFKENLFLENYNHVALSKQGNVYRIFFNGKKVGEETNSNITLTNHSSFVVGSAYTSLNLTHGKDFGSVVGTYDQFRVSKGNARFTDDFELPTRPYSNVSAGTVSVSSDIFTGTNASINEVKHCVSEAIRVNPGNRMTVNNFQSITDEEWNNPGGYSTNVDKYFKGFTFHRAMIEDDPFDDTTGTRLISESDNNKKFILPSTYASTLETQNILYSNPNASLTLVSKQWTGTNGTPAAPTTSPDIIYLFVVDEQIAGTPQYAVTRDGSTYTNVTFDKDWRFDGNKRVRRATIDVSSQPAGTDPRVKVTSSQGQELRIHAVGLQTRS